MKLLLKLCELHWTCQISILGDIVTMRIHTFYKKMTAAKESVLFNWKSKHPPSIKQWWRELLSYCNPENIMYNVKGQTMKFGRIWRNVILSL